MDDVSIQPDDGGDAVGFEVRVTNFTLIVHDETHPRLGTGIQADDVSFASKRDNVGVRLPRRIGIAQRRLNTCVGRCFYRRGPFNFVGFRSGCFEIFLHLGLQVFALRAEDGLYSVSEDDHAGCAESLEFLRGGLCYIVDV